MFGSGNTTLIISTEEMNDIMKIIKSLEKSGLIKDISETICRNVGMLLGCWNVIRPIRC